MAEIDYGFKHTSALCFGYSCNNLNGNCGVDYRVGVWCEKKSLQSSNFRKLKNLVHAVESMSKKWI